MGRDVASGRVALRGKMFTCGNKVGECILFLVELAVLVPAIAAFFAAANMSDGIDEAAIDQA